jgi:3'-phosphoadenosine 5'-phosphosulfate sulfotransferase (PAPS reductase)/FAD synthetase
MIRRQCTNEYKIAPMSKYIKKEFGIGRGKWDSKSEVNRMFGISLDEIERCKVSTDWWAVNKYPLVDWRMYRHEVIDYINEKHPKLKNPPRSSCYFCPFHSDDYWRRLKEKHPDEFAKAIEIDEKIRIYPKMNEECFLHRSRKPLKACTTQAPPRDRQVAKGSRLPLVQSALLHTPFR